MKPIATFFLTLFMATFLTSASAQKGEYDYTTAWKKVEDAERKGLPESALKVVNEIYTKAKGENQDAQFIKALIHQLKYKDQKEENVQAANIKVLEKELKSLLSSKQPAIAVLHSMIGELYWRYYQQNRWKFSNRTQTVQFKQEDIDTWSLEKIVSEAMEHYALSVGLLSIQSSTFVVQSDLSKQLGSLKLDEIITKGNEKGRSLRPTLYDFLAYRALEVFKNEEPDVTKPAYAFTLNKKEFLSDAATFSKLPIDTKDTIASKFFALRLLQELIAFHLNDKNPEALIAIDMERLNFVLQYATFSDKTPLFIQAAESLHQKYSSHATSTLVLHAIASQYYSLGQQYNPLDGDRNKWELKKAYELCEKAKNNFPTSDGAQLCENLQSTITAKSINAIVEAVNLPQKPFLARISYKNFTNLYWRVYKVTRSEVSEQRKKYTTNYEVDKEEKFLSYFLAKNPVKAGKAQLPTDGDFQIHHAEVKLDELPLGDYLIVFGPHFDFPTKNNGLAYIFTSISKLGFIHRNTAEGSTEVFVLDRETGLPQANVKAQQIFRTYNYQSYGYLERKGDLFTSNSEGYFKVPYQRSNDGSRQNFSFEFSLADDRLSSEPLENDYGSFNQFPTLPSPAQKQTFFFLDRSIYRPGQTIHFKGLAIENKGKVSSILANRPIKVVFRNANYQEVSSQQFTTTEYGSFHGTVTAPNTGLLGEMHLVCEDGSGQTSFGVEEYKRPKFEVKFESVKTSFRLGETIAMQGIAIAYSGANLQDAKVAYRVVRKVKFPYWWYSRSYYPSSPEVEIINGYTTTSAEGKFTVPFLALADQSIEKSTNPTFSYTIYADVTDINGETHTGETVVEVGYKALKLNVATETIDIGSGEKDKKWKITSTNFAKEFEPAKGQITISRLKNPVRALKKRLWERPDKFVYSQTEFYASFPNNVYNEEDDATKWPVDEQVQKTDFDSEKEKNLDLGKFNKWKPGKYVLEITSKDKYGEEVKEMGYFEVTNSASSSLEIPAFEYFLALKTKVEPQEKAQFLLGTSAAVKVLYEIEKEGEILHKEWIALNNEKRRIEIPIKEEYRGNIAVHYSYVKENRLFTHSENIQVPYTNKELTIAFETFRDKLQPGQKEEWRLKIKGKTADKVAAEMVAALYDGSLDAIRPHHWSASFWNINNPRLGWNNPMTFSSIGSREFARDWNKTITTIIQTPEFDQLNWFGYGQYYRYRPVRSMMRKGEEEVMEEAIISASPDMTKEVKAVSQMAVQSQNLKVNAVKFVAPEVNSNVVDKPVEKIKQTISPRKNFNETAFFYPNLKTNEAGEIVISFTIPEALTQWKMLGFAHTKELQFGFVEKQLVTQKELMVIPNQPRFFREGDKMSFSTKITNLTSNPVKGTTRLQFFDALSGKEVTNAFIANNTEAKFFDIHSNANAAVEWEIAIPEGYQAVTYRFSASSGNFTDAEEMTIPVVTNRTLVTETLPLPIRGKQTKTFVLDKLKNNTSTTLKNFKYTLEFTSNPAWYAIQALPYLMEGAYESVEGTFSRFYANSIASHIANSNPKIKQVFDTWRNIQPNALLSNLEKNQELKTALLEETPWVLQSQDEAQRKRNVALLFDLNKMGSELQAALDKVVKAQTANGGFTWFPGMPSDPFITQYIISGLGHLDVLGVQSVRSKGVVWEMTKKAISFCDLEMKKEYDLLKAQAKKKEIKLEEYHPGYLQIHYLYSRSYFKDVALQNEHKEAYNFFLGQAKKYWLQQNIYLEGLIALALHREGQKEIASAIVRSFRGRALHSEEMGMYFKQEGGYYWYQAPIETQSLLIEVFDEIANDSKAVEELKVWLLKQKQTQNWRTSKATAEACYALLRRGTDILTNTQIPQIQVGSETIDLSKKEDTKVEAGTGYFKTSWTADQIKPEMAEVKISKGEEGVAWGAVYWQYFEQLDKITSASTPLRLTKQLFLQQPSDRGPIITPIDNETKVKVGDVVVVRIELRSDRNMEYLHLKDMRAAGFEPLASRSQSKYQDGLWYYESPRDLSTSFFIGYLPKGTYVFEYQLRVSQKGDFSNGITSIQCFYAPEFSSYSEGVRVRVE